MNPVPPVNTILCGNCLAVLKGMTAEYVDMVITSPPYWALRNYSTIPQIWDGDLDCEHDFILTANAGDIRFRAGRNSNVGNNRNPEIFRGGGKSNFCSKCGAWMGELGLEPDFNLYIKHICDIFDEVKRVLKKEGSCWVNMGDTYSGSGCGTNDYRTEASRSIQGKGKNLGLYKTGGIAQKIKNLPAKSLCCIPDRFKIEMVNRGWICRNEIIWHKPNCMPSSTKDRFTVDYEKMFFFVKSKKYYFEQQFEPWVNNTYDIARARDKTLRYRGKNAHGYDVANSREDHLNRHVTGQPVGNPDIGRNKRCVWIITTRPFPEAHFAVYPPELIETPIKACCPEFVCRKCGKPRVKIYRDTGNYIGEGGYGSKTAEHIKVSPTSSLLTKQVKEKAFAGYSDCGCNAGFEPGIVLDPFMGSGTAALVARKLGRNFIGIELNPEYIAIAEKRLQRGYG